MGEKGKLTSVRLSRAEYLSAEDRLKYNLPKEGMIVIETRLVDDKETTKVKLQKGTAVDFLRSKFAEPNPPNGGGKA